MQAEGIWGYIPGWQAGNGVCPHFVLCLPLYSRPMLTWEAGNGVCPHFVLCLPVYPQPMLTWRAGNGIMTVNALGMVKIGLV